MEKAIIGANIDREEIKMKKRILIVLLVLALILCGCAGNGDATNNPGSSAATLPSGNTADTPLPQVEIYDVHNGFLRPVGDRGVAVISVESGEPKLVQLFQRRITFTRNGEQTEIRFGWYKAGECFFAEDGADAYSVAPIEGSERYAQLEFATQTDAYGYLIDMQKNAVLDPLALVDPEIVAAIDQIYFAPDGNHAMLVCDAGEVWRVLNCETGETQRLDELTGMENCCGSFMEDGDHIRVWTADASAVYAYSLSTGQCQQITGFTVYASGCETKLVDGCLTIVDRSAGTETKTQFTEAALDGVYWYGQNQVLVLARNTLYVLCADGSARAVCALTTGEAP